MREGRNIGRPGAVTAGVLFILLAIPSIAFADVRYAEPGGDGPEPCLDSDPCDAQIAVEGTVPTDVDDGDEVILLPGDYMLGANDLEVTDDIHLHGQFDQPRPRIFSTASQAVGTNVTGEGLISDLEIVHTGAGVALSTAIDVERVIATTSDGAACTFFTIARIRDSICRSTGGGQSAGVASGLGGVATYAGRLVNVTAIGADYGIRIESNTGGEVIITASNVIAAGGITDIRALTDATGNADVVLDHSNYATEAEDDDPDASVTDPGSGTNQTTDPLLSADFHQLAGSPTRNAGAVNADLGTLDVDRQPRHQGLAPDIGGDEFGEPTFRCAGQRATVVGTTGRDRIRGTAGRDVIASLGGKDVVRGLRGKDLICGGRGRDRLFGGPGRDRLLGQAGRDLLRGGPGRDRLRGGPGRDTQVQ